MSKKPIRMWGGFVNDRLHLRNIDTGHGGWGDHLTDAPAIFRRKMDARAEYQDVRRVEIREVKP